MIVLVKKDFFGRLKDFIVRVKVFVDDVRQSLREAEDRRLDRDIERLESYKTLNKRFDERESVRKDLRSERGKYFRRKF